LCYDGTCQEHKFLCKEKEAGLADCVAGTRRCEDGICRKKCPDFNGCPLSAPL